jgi:hypothetical protein
MLSLLPPFSPLLSHLLYVLGKASCRLLKYVPPPDVEPFRLDILPLSPIVLFVQRRIVPCFTNVRFFFLEKQLHEVEATFIESVFRNQ